MLSEGRIDSATDYMCRLKEETQEWLKKKKGTDKSICKTEIETKT